VDGETLLRETREYYGIITEPMAAAEVAGLYLRAIQYGELTLPQLGGQGVKQR
jgi:hypothetical protein